MMRRAFPILSVAALLVASPARADDKRVMEVHPYLGLDQTLVTQLKGGTGDTETYTSATVGVNVNIRNRTSEVDANLSYQHQFSWSDKTSDADVVSGLVRARTNLGTRGFQIEGGALATRVRTDGLTGANGNLATPGSKSNIYSFYAGPTYSGRVGDLDVRAAYRIGYNRLENGYSATANTPNLNAFDESWNHYATASVGMQPDVWLPVGWAVGVGYQREDMKQLDQQFENKWARFDLTLPVTASLAAIGGVGYQSIKASNRDAIHDSNGTPVLDANGRYVTDPASPRLLSYDDQEMIWDVGILWRPSRHTSLRLTYGHQYGSASVQGSFNWQPSPDTSVNISLFDSVDGFGRALTGGLANLPENFLITRNPFSGDVNSCAFGQGGGSSCLNSTLSGIRTANYRNRGVAGSIVHRQGALTYGIGLGYSRRKFLGDDPVYAGISGLVEENYFAAASVGYAIDGRSGITLSLYANQFSSELPGVTDVFNAGGYLNYHRQISRRLSATAAVGLDGVKPSGVDGVLSALAQIGVRYVF